MNAGRAAAVVGSLVLLSGCTSATLPRGLTREAAVTPAAGAARPAVEHTVRTERATAAGPRGWVWQVALRNGAAVNVGVVDLRLCFDGPPPRRVAPENALALRFLVRDARWVDDAGVLREALSVDEDGIVTAWLPRDACVAFGVDLEAAAAQLQRVDLALRFQRSVLASPDIWLWRPRPWPPGTSGTLVLAPGSASPALPFDDDGLGGYRVPPSTFILQSYALFGGGSGRVVERGGARLHVVVADADVPLDTERLDRWLTVAVDDVATPLGRFPGQDLLVVVAPVRGERAVLGGFLGRGGGRASVVVLVGAGAPTPPGGDDDAVIDDDGRWVLTHELAHTLLPPVIRADAWLNEGLATFHQETLPVRSGRRPAATAKQQLALGFATGKRRAEEDGLTLERACRAMDVHGSYQHCYWGGAALLALVADELGDEALTRLVVALHGLGPLDAAPRPALDLLAAVADAPEPVAAHAARRLIALWHAWRDRPFPDGTRPHPAASSSEAAATR